MRKFNQPLPTAGESGATADAERILAAYSGVRFDGIPNAFGTGRAGQPEQGGSFPSFSQEPAASWGSGFNNTPQSSAIDRTASFGFGSPQGRTESSASWGSSQEGFATTPERGESIRNKLQRALGSAANRLANMFGSRDRTEQNYVNAPYFTHQPEATPSTAWENSSMWQQASAESNGGFAARAASALDGVANTAHGAAGRMGSIRESGAFRFVERHSGTAATVGNMIDAVGGISQATRGYSAQSIYESRGQLANRGTAAAGDALRTGGSAFVRELASRYGIDTEQRTIASKRRLVKGIARLAMGGLPVDLMRAAKAGAKASIDSAKGHATASSSEVGW
ncbi:hypothetical protein EUA66_04655 [TM7 phylum sp. oral taxon 349]|jgi:hypothetical protein|nr:hypothetical protein EUA66_04655 [TM7 phylum sp. oral taxon 349]